MRERAAALTGCRAFCSAGRTAVCAGGRRPSCACYLWCRWVAGAVGPGRCVCWWAAAFLCVLLVVTLVLRAPSGPAAREIAARELRSERSISKPARALRTLRRPPHRRRLCRCAWLGASSRSPPVPSGPSGALHNSGAWWLIGGWARRLEARPGLAAARQHPGLVLRSGGAAACLLVVTLVLRAPSGPAAREIAARELRSEWSISKPARALRTLRRPPHRRRRCTLACARG